MNCTKSTVLFLLLGVILLFSLSCKKECKENEIASFSFSSKDKTLIPYQGDELLILKDHNGWCDTLKGKGRSDDFYRVYQTANNECNDYYSLEYNRLSFPTILVNKSAWLIQLAQEYTDPMYSYNQKYFYVSIGATYAPGVLFNESFLFNEDSIFTNNENVHFYNDLTIGDQEYTSIYRLEFRDTISTNFPIKRVFYNIHNGLVAVEKQDGNIYTITLIK